MARDQVLIFDTTLRDGEQCPGASMTVDEKIRIARQLENLRVDIIEAGFPVASSGDFEAVRAIASEIRESTVCALSRARRADIDRAMEALAPARSRRLHTFISTSSLHMQYKLQMTPEAVLEAIGDSVRYARNLFDDVEWSCEDGTRSDMEFLCRCFEIAIKSGATTVNIADTVGYALPTEFARTVRALRERVPGMDKVRFSVHCHDDLGLATANSIAALESGARQIECTVNGIGERAGNAPLEEVVMAIYTRSAILGLSTRLRTEELAKISQMVSTITGFAVPPNKAVVGSNAFAHESGIHQHGVIAHRATYEIMDPASVGANESRLVMGKHSGRHAFRQKLEQLGFNLGDNEFGDAFSRFKDFADSRKGVSDKEIVALVRRASNKLTTYPELESLDLETIPTGKYKATVRLLIDGNRVVAHAEGDGWMGAALTAMTGLIPELTGIENVTVLNVTHGPAPQFLATVRITGSSGTATDQEPTMAVVRACIGAVFGRSADKTEAPTGNKDRSRKLANLT